MRNKAYRERMKPIWGKAEIRDEKMVEIRRLREVPMRTELRGWKGTWRRCGVMAMTTANLRTEARRDELERPTNPKT